MERAGVEHSFTGFRVILSLGECDICLQAEEPRANQSKSHSYLFYHPGLHLGPFPKLILREQDLHQPVNSGRLSRLVISAQCRSSRPSMRIPVCASHPYPVVLDSNYC